MILMMVRRMEAEKSNANEDQGTHSETAAVVATGSWLSAICI